MNFWVEMTELDTAAKKIGNAAQQYQALYGQLYDAVGLMGSAWQGADNQKYVERINALRDDFERVHKLLVGDDGNGGYKGLLLMARKEYSKALEEATNAAKLIQ
jgi:WXG100 family type VII secretion target